MAVIYNIILARKPINNLLDFKSNLRNLRAKFVEKYSKSFMWSSSIQVLFYCIKIWY